MNNLSPTVSDVDKIICLSKYIMVMTEIDVLYNGMFQKT